jgi:deoxyribose-phosphate aldolase
MMSSTDTAALALQCLDLTDLGDTCGPQEVGRLLAAAQTPYGPVAAVCLWPQYVTRAALALCGSPVRIATVINFPAGGEDIERAVEDTREALRDGAHEIDLVIPYRTFIGGNTKLTGDMVAAVADCLSPGQVLKTILETGELNSPDLITLAAEIAVANGAHFLKTSTGKTAVSATPEAARVLAKVIKRTSRPVGLKVSGGIRSLADARLYMDIAAGELGADWINPSHFRIGASSLLTALLAELSDADG